MTHATTFTDSYHRLLSHVYNYGIRRPSRARLIDGSQPDTRSIIGHSLCTNFVRLDDFPILLTRPVAVRNTIGELRTFFEGVPSPTSKDRKLKRGPITSIKDAQFRANGCDWWGYWADDDGELGPIYGAQWRGVHPFYYDQIAEAVRLLIDDPFSRRIFVSAWRPEAIRYMALPPCHDSFQLITEPTDHPRRHRLHMIVRMRSCDIMCGLPHNHLSYSILLNIFVGIANNLAKSMLKDFADDSRGPYSPASLTFQFGDLHLYENHIDAARTLLDRPIPTPDLPVVLRISEFLGSDVCGPKLPDIKIENYHPADRIPGIEVAV